MIGKPAVELAGMLGERQQSVLLRRDGDPGRGVRVYDAHQVSSCHVDRGMNGEARGIDVAAAQPAMFLDDVAVHVDFHQVRGAHVLEVHAELVDQEVVVRSGQPSAEVGVDEVRPATRPTRAPDTRRTGRDFPRTVAAGVAPGCRVREDSHCGSMTFSTTG
jgi:hypothetical protein